MRVFAGRAAAARPALVDGLADAVWARGGRPAAAFSFVVRDGKVANIQLVSDPEVLADLEIREAKWTTVACSVRSLGRSTRPLPASLRQY
jgi:hypothetical protein